MGDERAARATAGPPRPDRAVAHTNLRTRVGGPAVVEERLASMVATWEPAGDRRAIFAAVYGVMTHRMAVAIQADAFDDTEWVARLLGGFADYYFVACDGHEGLGAPCPDVWRTAFDACCDERHHPLQLLLLGMNAHINHDLVFALADVLDDWDDLPPSDRDLRLADHQVVNALITDTVDEVQDAVVSRWSPGLGTLDWALGPVDEWVAGRVIVGWRDDVWDDAQRLLVAGDDERPAIESGIRERCQRTARMILAI